MDAASESPHTRCLTRSTSAPGPRGSGDPHAAVQPRTSRRAKDSTSPFRGRFAAAPRFPPPTLRSEGHDPRSCRPSNGGVSSPAANGLAANALLLDSSTWQTPSLRDAIALRSSGDHRIPPLRRLDDPTPRSISHTASPYCHHIAARVATVIIRTVARPA